MVPDRPEMKPKVEEMKITVIRHDEILKAVVDGQKEMRDDIKSILRSVK